MIREVREAFHMTQAEFSEKCDISESFLVAVEGGRKSITSTNVSGDYFIRGKGNGFETDSIIELIDSMDKRPKEGALNILREYVDVVHKLQQDKETTKKA